MRLLHNDIVHPWLCDVMGHMNTRYYMGMFDDASYQLLADATGWHVGADAWKGRGWADVSHKIEYRDELLAGTPVKIEGGIIDIGNYSFTSLYVMKNKLTDADAATLAAKVVYFDLEARRSLPLSAALRQRMGAWLIKTDGLHRD